MGTDIDVTAGRWKITGLDPAHDWGGMKTVYGSQTAWPQDITDWQYYDDGKWHPDPNLSVTGNSYIEISVSILTVWLK